MKRVVLVLFLLSVCGASAQRGREGGPGRPPAAPLMGALDLDSDGELSAEELEKASASLGALDGDGDGKLSRGELRPRRVGRRGRGGGARPGPTGRRGGGGPRPTDIGRSPLDLGQPGIAWYGRWDLAKREARRSNRPLLFMAAASQCGGVPGVF